jgi:hypothetical protein
MALLTPDNKCALCKGMLVPPSMAFGLIVAANAQFVCYVCHQPYRWAGDPPRLTMLTAVDGKKDSF